MKKYLIIGLLLLCTTFVYGQTAFTVRNLNKESLTKDVSLNNPWVGAKVSYDIAGDLSQSQSFIFSAKVLQTIKEGDNFAIPVVGDIALGNANPLASQSGFNVGLYPYYVFNPQDKTKFVLHGGVGYKIIPDLTEQIRFTGGVEVAHFNNNELPITLSVTPVYVWDDLGNFSMLETTLIYPISNGLGLMAEYQRPFKSETESNFRLGVIINSRL